MENLSNNERQLFELIDMWIEENEYMKRINQTLYENTQLFEHGYEINFDEKLHNFFASKITRFQKDTNKLYSLLPEKYFKWNNGEEK